MFVYWRSVVNGSGATAPSHSNTRSIPSRFGAAAIWQRPIFREVLILAVVVVVAVVTLRGPTVGQGFTIDESRWIATSRYFWITFIDHDLLGPAWQPNYIVLTHPPVARYVIGYGLWLQGWTPDQLNGRYDSLQNRAYNERARNVPSPALLVSARSVTFVFAVTSVALVYGIGRTLGGPVAGLAAAGFVLVNPLLTTVWTRALAESIVAAFGLLTLLLALRFMPRVTRGIRQAWLPLLLGVALALAAATKLNGGIGVVGLGLFAAIQQGMALLRTQRTAGLRSWIDIGLAAIIVFVVVNPLLYVNPIERMVALVRHRQDEMQFQRTVFDDQAVPAELGARVARVGRRAFGTWATPAGPLPVSPDMLLVPAGLALLLWRARCELIEQTAGPSLLFLCWLAATYAIVTVNLGFDSSHYFAPIVTLNLLLGGTAISGGMMALWRRTRRDRSGHGSGTQYTHAPTT